MTTAPVTPRAVVREGLTVGIAVGFYAVSFGAVSVAAGLSVLQTCAMSLLMFTGASQFAFVGVVASGGTPTSATVTAALLGARNALYGLRLAPLLGFSGWRRTAAAHLVIDESTAMSIARPTQETVRAGFLSTGLGVFASWNTFTLVGALAGDAIGDPRDVGRRHATQMPDALAAELAQLNVGGITKPRVVENGVSMLAVCSKEVSQDTSYIADNLRQTAGNGALKSEQDKYLAELRSKAQIVVN